MRIALLALWIMALAAPMPVMSQGRQGGNRQNHTERPTRQPQHRPGGGDRRPQQPRPPQSNKPRPSRPSQPQRPGGHHTPPPPHQQPGRRPAPHRNWGRPSPPPPHYHRVPRPMPPRPVAPPPGYRPFVGAPAIRSILGITFGTLYGSALDFLSLNGYVIDGYADNTIYLSDVSLLNLTWPIATLYCNASGRLSSAQFSYYSVSAAMGRYNQTYNLLCGTYGPPISLTTNGATRSVMWYGGNNTGYITLEHSYAGGGYYTTLSVSI